MGTPLPRDIVARDRLGSPPNLTETFFLFPLVKVVVVLTMFYFICLRSITSFPRFVIEKIVFVPTSSPWSVGLFAAWDRLGSTPNLTETFFLFPFEKAVVLLTMFYFMSLRNIALFSPLVVKKNIFVPAWWRWSVGLDPTLFGVRRYGWSVSSTPTVP